MKFFQLVLFDISQSLFKFSMGDDCWLSIVLYIQASYWHLVKYKSCVTTADLKLFKIVDGIYCNQEYLLPLVSVRSRI